MHELFSFFKWLSALFVVCLHLQTLEVHSYKDYIKIVISLLMLTVLQEIISTQLLAPTNTPIDPNV